MEAIGIGIKPEHLIGAINIFSGYCFPASTVDAIVNFSTIFSNRFNYSKGINGVVVILSVMLEVVIAT